MEVIIRADDKKTMNIPKDFAEEWENACYRAKKKYGKTLERMLITKETKAAKMLRREIEEIAPKEEIIKKADRRGIDRIELDQERKKQHIEEIKIKGELFWRRKHENECLYDRSRRRADLGL